MLAAIYARYSSDKQREASLEDQERSCRRRAEQEGWTVVQVYADAAISGSRMDRPGYAAPAVGAQVERSVRPLRPYMCYCGDAADGAVLAWAHTAQDARKLAYPAIADWTDCGFIDVRARLLKKHPAYYETLKLKDSPHVNDNPPCCPVCELWGNPPLPDGSGCEFCGVNDGA